MQDQHQKQQCRPYKTGIVLGNGTSRLLVPLDKLKSAGMVYGCNALYREYEPDYLIAVDVKMINEIIQSGYHKTHQVWTNKNKGITPSNNVNYFSPNKGWSSGPTALWLATVNGHSQIYIIGFDYTGINGKLNNVYADTLNYKKSTDIATYYGNWLNQTYRVVSEFPNTIFYRVVPRGSFIPDELFSKYKNLVHISTDEFLDKL